MSGSASRRLLWTGCGAAGIGVGALWAAHSREGPGSGPDATLLRSVPLNLLGIAAHYAASIPVPGPLRSTVYSSYCATVGCDPEEADGRFQDYRSLAHFFGRRLRKGVRPIHRETDLVVPCDGRVVGLGQVEAYGCIKVKGNNYFIRELVGADDSEPLAVSSVAVADRKESGARLWYSLIHIEPGQCHRFSSPATWRVSERRHIEGYVLWLKPIIRNLYSQNERVALLGNWDHGFFSMTAVGAAGRGSITLDANKESFKPKLRPSCGKASKMQYSQAEKMHPGHSIGGFKLGSAIVLVFEAPEGAFTFHVKPGDKVRLGERLASINNAEARTSATDGGGQQAIKQRRDLGGRARFRRAW